MLTSFFKRLIMKNKTLILREAQNIRDFMMLLMKRKNTSLPWTPDEIKQLKSHLIRMSFYVPVLMIILLPGGKFLLPVLAEVLDRREQRRHALIDGDTMAKAMNGKKEDPV